MLEQKDDYCKIITDTEEDRKLALRLLAWLGVVAAERLVNEPKLEVRKYKSGIQGLDDHAVVMCSRRVLWNIPRKILIAVKVKK